MSGSDVPEPDEPRVDGAGGAVVPSVPERSADDTDTGWGQTPAETSWSFDEQADDHEEWLREQRPPHWD